MKDTVEHALARVAATGGASLFTLAQARAAGASDDQLNARVERGLYERVGRGLFGIAGVPWTWERKAYATLLAAGPAAVVSHRAAAYVLGFDGFGECPIELTVPRNRRVRTDLAVVHRSLYLDRIDVTRVGRVPVTSGARTIVDLCYHGVGAEAVSAAIGSAIRDGYTSVVFLRKRLSALRGPGRHGVRLLDAVLAGPIAHSHLERVFLRLVSAAGIETPETQVIFDGETIVRVDFLWRAAKVVVEVMGHRFHVTREQLQRDAQRRTELQEIDHFVMEITSDDLARRPAQKLAQLKRILQRRTPRAA